MKESDSMNDILNKITRNFIVNEGEAKAPTLLTHIQSVYEVLSNMKPKTQTESRRISMAKHHIKEIKKMSRKLQERLNVLEERMKVLEEAEIKKGEN